MRRGKKDTCYCGREIRWNGKYWEHTEGSYRHIAKPADKKSPPKLTSEKQEDVQAHG